MKKIYRYLPLLLTAFIFSIAASAQTITVSGNIKDQVTAENLSAVSVTVKGGTAGLYTDDKGNFKLTTTGTFPLTLIISSVGYESLEVTASTSDALNIVLTPSAVLGLEIVVAASRMPERILESPVTIESMGVAAIRQSAAADFYETIANLKGVYMMTSSINFRTVSTRGFTHSGNLRVNQIVDGMDNQAPGLNFSVGNFFGGNELDVESVELLPGASSALYGPGGMNGTLLITSKSPFKYQGFSFLIKQGMNHADKKQRDIAPYYDWAFRWGKVINDKLAFKIAAQFISAQDWQANDDRNYDRNLFKVKAGDRTTPDYDGVNVYGDDIKAPMMTVFNAMAAAGVFGPNAAFLRNIIPTQEVSRTGYNERELADYSAYNLKTTAGINYKIKPNLEASLLGYWGTGTTVYTGADRYSLGGVKMGQYKAELKATNWFIRGYTTQENAGDAFAVNIMATLMNESWRPSVTGPAPWFPTYIGAFVTAAAGPYTAAYTAAFTAAMAGGSTPALANAAGIAAGRSAIAPLIPGYHAFSRSRADVGRLIPGSAAFKTAFNDVKSRPIPRGSRFLDRSDLYASEFQYNLTHLVKVADVLIGGNLRQFVLNSEGTLFADTAGVIKINEYGGYIQIQKKLFDDKLKLTASGRYDKNENFKGKFTPRISAMYTIVKDNNLRISYQTGYRFPSTQQQYIDLRIPAARLIGGLPGFRDYYNFNGNSVYTLSSFLAFAGKVSALAPIIGLAAALTEAAKDLVVGKFDDFKPESVRSFEVGYRGIIAKKLMVDAYWYRSIYSNFIGNRNFVQSIPRTSPSNVAALLSATTRQIYNIPINVPGEPEAQGFGIGLDYSVGKGFNVKVNYSTDTLKNVPVGFESSFNTPKHRWNFGISNANVYKGFGFNVMYRKQSAFYYEATFGGGDMPAIGTVDAQINYRIPKTKNMIKIGASNIFNKYYYSAFGNPQIGGLYYVSYGYNIF